MHDYGLINASLDPDGRETGTLAASLHGFCVGALCVAASDLWSGFLEEYLPAGQADAPPRELADALAALLQESAATLAEGQFEFELLLPDEDLPLALRTACLAAWADGYLRGLSRTAVELSLTENAEEALRDVEAVAQVDPDVDDDDEAEGAFTEVCEHLRIAVAQLYAEFAGARAAAAEADDDEPPAGEIIH
jgi:uncharacterized protein YgfB (UPF0149 family)